MRRRCRAIEHGICTIRWEERRGTDDDGSWVVVRVAEPGIGGAVGWMFGCLCKIGGAWVCMWDV